MTLEILLYTYWNTSYKLRHQYSLPMKRFVALKKTVARVDIKNRGHIRVSFEVGADEGSNQLEVEVERKGHWLYYEEEGEIEFYNCLTLFQVKQMQRVKDYKVLEITSK